MDDRDVRCCPRCRLVQHGDGPCAGCGIDRPVTLGRARERFLVPRGTGFVLAPRAPPTGARDAAALLATAGATLAGGGLLAAVSHSFFGMCVGLVAPAAFGLWAQTRRVRWGDRGPGDRLAPADAAWLAGPAGDGADDARELAWRGVVRPLAREVTGALTGARCVASSVVVRESPGGRVLLRYVSAADFLVVDGRGAETLVAGSVWYEAASPDATALTEDAAGLLRALGVPADVRVEGVVEEHRLAPGARVVAWGERHPEALGEAATYRRAWSDVARGAPGRPVLVRAAVTPFAG